MTPELPNYSPDPSLTPVQHRVLALLAEGQSLTEAAAQAGVHRNTVRNWRRSVPAFARDCEFAVREQAVAWHDHLLQLAPQAAQVLHSVLHDESASPSLRLRAAVAVLKASADPHPKPLALIGTVTAELEALNGYCLAQKPPVVHNELPKTRTIDAQRAYAPASRTRPKFPVPLRLRAEIQAVLRQPRPRRHSHIE